MRFIAREGQGRFPPLAYEQPAQPFSLLLQDESGLRNCLPVVGKGANSETGENSEGPVKKRDQRLGNESSEAVRGEAEFRNNPGSTGLQVVTNPEGKRGNFISGEAVEKEVGHDQVIGCRRRFPCADVGNLDVNAVGLRAGAASEFREHGRTGVDSVDNDGRIFGQQAGNESAVAIAQDFSGALG